jgi:gas vesicle protein
MFSRVRIAIRFFFVGLAVGILLAPRSGEETRRLVREKADRLLNDVLDAATLGTIETGTNAPATTAATATEGSGESAPRPTRGGNGSRSRAKSTAASEAGV